MRIEHSGSFATARANRIIGLSLCFASATLLATPALAGEDCETIFDDHESLVEKAERLSVSGAPLADLEFAAGALGAAEELERKHGYLCFGYFERGKKLRERRADLSQRLEKSLPAPIQEEPAQATGESEVKAEAPASFGTKPAATSSEDGSPDVESEKATPEPKPASLDFPAFWLGFGLQAEGTTGGSFWSSLISRPAFLSIGVDVASWLSLYAGFGFYVYKAHYEYNPPSGDGDRSDSRLASFILAGGVMIRVIPPRPEAANVYLSAEFNGVVAAASLDDSDDYYDDNNPEKELEEYADYWSLAGSLGV